VATLVELAPKPWEAPLKELATGWRSAAAADGLLQARPGQLRPWRCARRADLESTSRGLALLAARFAGLVPGLEGLQATIPGEPAASRFQPKPQRRRPPPAVAEALAGGGACSLALVCATLSRAQYAAQTAPPQRILAIAKRKSFLWPQPFRPQSRP